MKTIGSRLTLLYVVVVAGTIASILLLGSYVLRRHLEQNLDATLQSKFLELKNRLSANADVEDVQGLLVASQIDRSFSVQVEDLWNDPTYRQARSSGIAVTGTDELQFSDLTLPGGDLHRAVEGISQSLRIRVSTSLVPLQEAMQAYGRIGGGIAFVVLLVSVIAGHLLSRVALRPMQLIERTAARISSDNLSERIPVKAVADEISNLARLLNQTFDRLESSFEQIKRFAGDASHELKTPLSLVRLNLERIVLHGALPPEDQAAMQDCIEEINHLNRLIENLLFLSRVEAREVELQRQPVDTAAFIEGFSHDAELLAEAAGITLAISRNDAGTVSVDANRIRQVLLNLFSNAIKFSPPASRIELASLVVDGWWHVTITDEGPGVPDDKLDAIFQRFVRIAAPEPSRNSAQPGTGLGLAISRSIVELHGGLLRATNRPERSGLQVRLACPIGPGLPGSQLNG